MAVPNDGAELAEILSRDIPWEIYMTARLIADKDLQLIRRYDKRSEELQASLLDESGPAYIEAFLTVLRNVTKEETVQYILALLLQMLRAYPARAALFHQVGEAHVAAAGGAGGQTDLNPYLVLLRLLQRADWFTQEKSCKLLTRVIAARPHRGAPFVHVAGSSSAAAAGNGAAAGPGDPAEPHITSFVEWLCGQLRRPSNPPKSVPTAVSALAVLLRDKATRGLFTAAGGVGLLAPLLRSCTGPTSSQLAYEICLCIWQLSYHKPAVQALASSGVAKGLVEVVKSAQKEKVVRVALLSLRNLLGEPELGAASDMVEAGLPKVLATRGLQSLAEALREQAVVLSSWDKYKKEVLSGSLDWSPMHTSEGFWRSHVDKFEDKDFQLLRVLLKLLESSRETRTVAVACNDVGRFVEYHPHGRYVVSDLNGKELMMRLLASPDADVQKRSLLALQKIMLPRDKLDFMRAANSGA
ncbi:vacuolar ATP synthase subunit H [Scenedesmus sp. NREL 46B-D3]|nr:vacuolar ATP synthase subunit H [Scenedesmus sp. NREL 46B-D3]